jgi:GDPmannose 4,6-dehydratase
MKKAIITGATGQDGAYMSEYLLSLGYEVHGIVKGVSGMESNYVDGVIYHVGDLRDELSLENAFRKVWPDEIYNFGAQTFVPTSWTQPEETFDVNVSGLGRLLKIVEKLKKDTKVYQAGTSEQFGNVGGALNEYSPMRPVSPYGVSKLAAHHLVDVYRQVGLFVVGGVLFNHESPRRAMYFVTRKITLQVAKWALGDRSVLKLGDVKAERDWSHAVDMVRGIHMMMQQDKPDDYVLGSGMSYSISQFLDAALKAAKLKVADVHGLIEANAKEFMRQGELYSLKADASKAKIVLGWEPKISFDDLVKQMVEFDIDFAKLQFKAWDAASKLLKV